MSTNYIEKVKRMQSSSWVGYWPLNEERGTTVYNAVKPSTWGTTTPEQNGTSVSLVRVPATAGFLSPDGGVCAQLDGSTSYINMASALSSSATTIGSLGIWAATTQANLAGSTKMVLFNMAVSTSYELEIQCDTTAYRFTAEHNGNSSKTSTSSLVYNVDGAPQDPEWHHFGMDFYNGGSLNFYVDGVAQTAATGLGTWSGTLSATRMTLGSTTTTITDAYNGYLSHFVWSNAIFTADEWAELAKAGP